MTRAMWAYAVAAVFALGVHGTGTARRWFVKYRTEPVIDLRGSSSGGGSGGGFGGGGFRGGK